MRVLRTAVLALGTIGALLLANPANAAGIVIVEGESASSYTTGCGDGGDSWDMGPYNYGGRQTMGFPASGCSASYHSNARAILSATFMLSGQAPSICGTITVSGTTVGAVAGCNANDTEITVTFSPPVVTATGDFTVTWTTGPATASYCNLFLDYLVGVSAP
jgi:hypothetical protein